MDGDEKRSGGIAVCDGGTGDEAVTSGDVAPAPVDGEPAERESAEDVPVETESSGDAATADEVFEALDEASEEAGSSDEAGR